MDLWALLDRVSKVWGLLAALGVVAWLVKRFRRADLSVEVAHYPSTVPLDLLESTRDLLKALERVLAHLPIPSNDLQVENISALKAAASVDSMKKVSSYRAVYADISLLRITLRNKTTTQIKDVRIYLEPRFGVLSSSKVWGVDIGGKFLTAEDVKTFQNGVTISPNFV